MGENTGLGSLPEERRCVFESTLEPNPRKDGLGLFPDRIEWTTGKGIIRLAFQSHPRVPERATCNQGFTESGMDKEKRSTRAPTKGKRDKEPPAAPPSFPGSLPVITTRRKRIRRTATRKLVFPSGPIDVTGTFQVESEAISHAGRFLFCAIPHLEIHAEHMEFDALLPHSKSMWTSKERQPEKGSARPWFSEESFFSALFSVSWSKFGAAEILPPVHREDPCVLLPYLNARTDSGWCATMPVVVCDARLAPRLKQLYNRRCLAAVTNKALLKEDNNRPVDLSTHTEGGDRDGCYYQYQVPGESYISSWNPYPHFKLNPRLGTFRSHSDWPIFLTQMALELQLPKETNAQHMPPIGEASFIHFPYQPGHLLLKCPWSMCDLFSGRSGEMLIGEGLTGPAFPESTSIQIRSRKDNNYQNWKCAWNHTLWHTPLVVVDEDVAGRDATGEPPRMADSIISLKNGSDRRCALAKEAWAHPPIKLKGLSKVWAPDPLSEAGKDFSSDIVVFQTSAPVQAVAPIPTGSGVARKRHRGGSERTEAENLQGLRSKALADVRSPRSSTGAI
ncbi:hypothetical protein V8G54_000071 (mitochondrion) [Vigna mungo]|uniref:Uncharacterized protein n=1 Tax=Vigna mungo TaxID=3915 RepID=A0AAQ3PKL6_VIGMU